VKGDAYEREVCKELSLWWSYGRDKRIFSRTRGSGSALKRGGSKWEGGDIGFVHPSGEPLIRVWNVEAKTGYAVKSKLKSGKTRESNWCALDIIDADLKKPTLLDMWEQCERDALITGREPILIFRRYRRRSAIAFTSSFFGSLVETFGRPDQETPLLRIYTPDYLNQQTMIRMTLVVIRLTDFFEWVPDVRPLYGYTYQHPLYVP